LKEGDKLREGWNLSKVRDVIWEKGRPREMRDSCKRQFGRALIFPSILSFDFDKVILSSSED